MSEKNQTIAWIVLGLVILSYMLWGCTYSINVVQTKGVSTDAIDEQDSPELIVPVNVT